MQSMRREGHEMHRTHTVPAGRAGDAAAHAAAHDRAHPLNVSS
jgi:hypothetical protein